MVPEPKDPLLEEDSQEDLKKSIRHFGHIMTSNIQVQSRMGDRVKNSIRAGMSILVLLAISILILMMTLTFQMNKIAAVVADVDSNFVAIADEMININTLMVDMESRVAHLPAISRQTQAMDDEMQLMQGSISSITDSVNDISIHVTRVNGHLGSISQSMVQMDAGVEQISGEMSRMAQPAQTINRFFPLP